MFRPRLPIHHNKPHNGSLLPKNKTIQPTSTPSNYKVSVLPHAPTIKQLTPLIKEPFRLIPKTGLSPLKSQITYHPPYTDPIHSVYPCPTYQCNLCTSYYPLINTSLPIPVIPCSRYRCLYLLHYKTKHRLHLYLASTNLHPSCLWKPNCEDNKTKLVRRCIPTRPYLGFQL